MVLLQKYSKSKKHRLIRCFLLRAAGPGLEPGSKAPKASVLPLDDPAIGSGK